MDSLPSRCLVIIALIIITGVLRCFEASIENVNEAKLQKLSDDGNSAAKKALKLTGNSIKFYNSIRVITVLTDFLISAISVYTFPDILFSSLSPKSGVALSIIMAAVFTLIFGIYVPKRIADKYADEIVFKSAGLLTFIYYICLPFTMIFTFISNMVLRLFGISPTDIDEEVTEEEIRMMVDIGSESGAIAPDEKEMIHNIFELDDTSVKDIMTHRTDAVLLWFDEKDEWEEIISSTNHSIYPVCKESIDNIIGTLNSKDFYKTLRNGCEITSILRPAYFVPETIKADDLFRQMQKSKTHFAVVLDEYGGLGGIITMSDLLEEIVGNLSNEYDESEDDDIVQLDSNTWKISGSCDIDLVRETLGVDLPVEEYNTFAGMILSELGEIPEDGSTPELEAYGLQIRVTKIAEHRIEEAKVSVIDKPPKEKENK
ncbi:MAG: hemolysin family protein [Firmicutes bacterium]|nr:hemolysin family protein [Bacillota bacterium]